MAKRIHENRAKIQWEICTSSPDQVGRLTWELLPGGKAAKDGKKLAQWLRETADTIDGTMKTAKDVEPFPPLPST